MSSYKMEAKMIHQWPGAAQNILSPFNIPPPQNMLQNNRHVTCRNNVEAYTIYIYNYVVAEDKAFFLFFLFLFFNVMG
jgi:hypothetical protein